MTELVRVHVDLDALEVIAAIDLAEVLRESTGSVSSQARARPPDRGMPADDTVSRRVDRVLRRPHPGAVTP